MSASRPALDRSREGARDPGRCVGKLWLLSVVCTWRDGGQWRGYRAGALNPAAACATSLPAQDSMDARTAVMPAVTLMDLQDRGREAGVGFGPLAHRAIAPDVIADTGETSSTAHQPLRIAITMVLDEAEAHARVPAKIAIDFLRNSQLVALVHLQDESE